MNQEKCEGLTFADQAVIAIQNVRLFKELQARTGELTQSVEKLTALGEVSRAVSSTLDVETVLDTIVSRATQLAGADGCAISEYEDATEVFHARATHGIDAALVGTLRSMPLRKGEGLMGRAAETREPIEVADIAVPGAYESQVRGVLLWGSICHHFKWEASRFIPSILSAARARQLLRP